MLQPRVLLLLIFAACAALLGYGYYLQYGRGLEPCPLCIFQRVCFFAAGLIALAGALHDPDRIGMRVYGGLTLLAAIAGLVFAGRQVWLQHLPKDQVPACGPGLEYWMKTLPFTETFRKVLRGTGECATVDWTFLGLSIAEWSLIWFALFAIGCLAVIVRAEDKAYRL